MILKKVNPDFYWFKCPQCGNTGKIDGEQARGKVSIQCMNKDCTYHETKNWLEDKPYYNG